MIHEAEGNPHSLGRARASKAEIVRMASQLEADLPLEIRVRLRSGSTDVWRRRSTKDELYELVESTS